MATTRHGEGQGRREGIRMNEKHGDEGDKAPPPDGEAASPRPDGGARARRFRKSLRNQRINYRNGWFFVTTQVARNKCVLGAIAQGRCVLTPLGEAVRDCWLALPAKHPELELDEFMVMPNHFHAILRIHPRPTNKAQHLGYLMSRFKGGTGYVYGKMKRGLRPGATPSERGASAPLCPDIGPHLWQFDYWDDLISSAGELENQRRYVRENPGRWSRDRFGPCTEHAYGNLDLLSAPRVAFVASQGFPAAALQPKKISGRGAAGSTRLDMEKAVIISTFTSAQEREALRRALAKGRRVIAVLPGGLPEEAGKAESGAKAPRCDTGAANPRCDTDAADPRFDIGAAGFGALLAAAREGRALLLSPQPPNSRINKKVATWCNEYVLAHAREIWAGDVSAGGTLHALLQAAPAPAACEV